MIEAFVLVHVSPLGWMKLPQSSRLDESSNVMETVKKEIAKVQGVKEVKGVFGRYDFVTIVESGTSQELGMLVSAIRNIKGVAETETLVVF